MPLLSQGDQNAKQRVDFRSSHVAKIFKRHQTLGLNSQSEVENPNRGRIDDRNSAFPAFIQEPGPAFSDVRLAWRNDVGVVAKGVDVMDVGQEAYFSRRRRSQGSVVLSVKQLVGRITKTKFRSRRYFADLGQIVYLGPVPNSLDVNRLNRLRLPEDIQTVRPLFIKIERLRPGRSLVQHRRATAGFENQLDTKFFFGPLTKLFLQCDVRSKYSYGERFLRITVNRVWGQGRCTNASTSFPHE